MSNKSTMYAVTNNGNDVEESTDLLDFLIKKFELTELMRELENTLKFIWEALLTEINSYPLFMAIKEFVDQLLIVIEAIAKTIDPVLAFSIFQK